MKKKTDNPLKQEEATNNCDKSNSKQAKQIIPDENPEAQKLERIRYENQTSLASKSTPKDIEKALEE